MYDLIEDIHGHATELTQLLQKLGYTKNKNGVYAHPTRKVIFAGDFIDICLNGRHSMRRCME